MTFTKKQERVALTIAGSDPSGGAGIQADLKTFAVTGVYGGAVISCLTVQNTQGVFAIQPVEPGLVKKQLEAVLNDLNVTHIKIGMLGSAAVAESLSETLKNYSGELIYDPVLVSSSGYALIDEQGRDVISSQLLPLCTVLTPNTPELSALSGSQCSTKDALVDASKKIFQHSKKLRSIIITGGHSERENDLISDVLLTNRGLNHAPDYMEISHPRIASRNTHGTGCTFSAAFTAHHLLTGDDSVAFRKATEFMATVISKSASCNIGHGTGPLMHHLK